MAIKRNRHRPPIIIPEFVDMNEQVRLPGKMPSPVDGTLRQYALRVPEAIEECSGIIVFGRKIKSLVFSTDLAIIKNINADAVFAVYPFTPQPIIAESLLSAADIPVFVGVGGGLTQGRRVVNLAMFAEMQGALGVVVNSPTSGLVLTKISRAIDIPVVVTVTEKDTDFRRRIDDGAAIFNVAAASDTPDIIKAIKDQYPDVPVIATAVQGLDGKIPQGPSARLIKKHTDCSVCFLRLFGFALFAVAVYLAVCRAVFSCLQL